MNETMPERPQPLTGPLTTPSLALVGGAGNSGLLGGRTRGASKSLEKVIDRARAALDGYQYTRAFESPPAPDADELAACLNLALTIIERDIPGGRAIEREKETS